MFDQIIIAGNLGRDPEMRYTGSGQAVTNFSVATNRQYTNSEGQVVKITKWFRVTTWGKLAEICNEYLGKGSKVLVVGELTADNETGGPKVYQKTGDKGYGASFEINAGTVRFLSSRGEVEVTQEEELEGAVANF